jgi:hypothetical protein
MIQTAACNRHHTMEPALCRCLCRRSTGALRRVVMTHETGASMLACAARAPFGGRRGKLPARGTDSLYVRAPQSRCWSAAALESRGERVPTRVGAEWN